jgi:hypothetical protein
MLVVEFGIEVGVMIVGVVNIFVIGFNLNVLGQLIDFKL